MQQLLGFGTVSRGSSCTFYKHAWTTGGNSSVKVFMVRPGEVRLGEVRSGMARLGEAWYGMVRQGMAGSCNQLLSRQVYGIIDLHLKRGKNQMKKIIKVVTVSALFPELRGGRCRQQGRGTGSTLAVAMVSAVRNLVKQPGLKAQRYSAFTATFSVGTITEETTQ